jgi:arabinogalactan endo-1,4-beta-galactosidase
MILGIDASTYLEELAHGAKYFDGDRQVEPLEEFVKNGVNHMRIRVWNHPYSPDGEPYLAGTADLDNYVKLGKLAKAKGYHLYMDLHYSDFWADPGKQFIPKEWEGYNLDQLTEAVYSFTKHCLEVAIREGVAPEMVQVGNEITNGILWPVGKLWVDDKRGNYESLTRLLDAGCRACRETLPSAKIMLHLEKSNDKEIYQEFFTEMEKAKIDFDVIGASYYPFWHGTPDELFENLNACRRFGKEIMICELGYGFTTEGYFLNGSECRLVIDESQSRVPGFSSIFPMTPEGQQSFVHYIMKRARENSIDGVFYWEPVWIPGEGICWASEAGQKYIHEEGKTTYNEWANQCLFDYEGRKLPAFDEFK